MTLGRKGKLISIVLLVVSACLLVPFCCLWFNRYDLWRDRPAWRSFVRYFILYDASLTGASKEDALKLLGDPFLTEGGYLVWWEDVERLGPGPDLLFQIDDQHQITNVTFVWADFHLGNSTNMDFDTWKDQDRTTKALMNTDLVNGWAAGNYHNVLQNVGDVQRFFPSASLVDDWQYPTDGGDGLGGAITLRFDVDGKLRERWLSFID